MTPTFLALPMPEAITDRLRLLQMVLPLPARVEPEDLHLTLAYLGPHPDTVLEALHDGLSAMRAPALTLALQGVGTFGRAKPRVVWAGVAPNEALLALQAKVAQVAVRAGVAVSSKGYLPHVTLGRFQTPAPDAVLRLERAVVAEQGFQAGPWLAESVVLYASHAARHGPRYQALESYALA